MAQKYILNFLASRMRIYKKSLVLVGVVITLYICFTLRTNLKVDQINSRILEDNSPKADLPAIVNHEPDIDTRKALVFQTQTREEDNTRTSNLAKCNINGEQTIKCLRNDNDIFVPFTFIKQYFDIFGDIKDNTLYWQHSDARVIMLGQNGYRPDGVFMSFDYYNVEGRERVFCLTGAEGVPYSTQWDRKPYPYAIQIAQFGLSHYSKMLREKRKQPVQTIGTDKNDWDIAIDCDFNIVNNTIDFSCPPRSQVHLTEVPSKLPIMSVDVLLTKGASLSLVVDVEGRGEIRLVFTPGKFLLKVSRDKKTIWYGLGLSRKWIELKRMVKIDIRKGLASVSPGKKGRKGRKKRSGRRKNGIDPSDGLHIKFRSIRRLILQGRGKIRGLSFRAESHRAMFLQAARWLVRHQTKEGAWPVMVRRRFGASKLKTLKPGWHSAMAQGHAMSLLVRAYKYTKKAKFLDAALLATKIFEVDVKDGGVRTFFADKYPWYEEYPTTPSLFVLNGFIYSLIGLYDLAQTAGVSDRGAKAFELYQAGLQSLNFTLPMFDTGSGSFYDFRHVILHSAPNLARWDYHSTHITQLLLLNSIDKSNPLWLDTATRWLSYTRGQRAPHN